MKNFTLLLLLIAASTFTGCKKDADEKAAENIIGKWQKVSTASKTYLNGGLTDQNTDTDYDATDIIEFRSNGTAVDDNGKDEYTYTVTGSKLTMKEVGHDDEELVYEIKKINSSDLVIYGEETYLDGTNNYKYTSEVTLKKK